MALNITLVEPAGPVGRELLVSLGEERVPLDAVRLLGSGESVGQEIDLPDGVAGIEAITQAALDGSDIVFFLPGSDARRTRPARAAVIDLSGTAPEALLVSPYVNEEALDDLESARGKVIALPSASAAQLATV